MTTDIHALSALARDGFVAALDGIYEHSPWIPERAWNARPFDSVDALHQAMQDVLARATVDEQVGLICAHPELAGKEAESGTLTAASTSEQRGAGLDQCSRDELLRLRSLNAAYRERFGFPFVIAVKGLTRYQILDAIAARIENPRDEELRNCLTQIGRIARFRLDALFNGA